MTDTNIGPIRDEAGYDMALAAIDRLMGVEPGTPEAAELEALVSRVEAYEAAHWLIEEAAAAEVIRQERDSR